MVPRPSKPDETWKLIKCSISSTEVSKSNFRQYGEMERQRWEESERRRKEARISEKRKSEKKEEAGAGKGRKVAILGFFPMICGPRGSKSNVAKTATHQTSDHFWNLRCRKSGSRCGGKHVSKSKVSKTHGLGPL